MEKGCKCGIAHSIEVVGVASHHSAVVPRQVFNGSSGQFAVALATGHHTFSVSDAM